LALIIESRPVKSTAFNNGVLASEPSTSSVTAYGGPDPAEAVRLW
jgi:hypothetical protein